MFFFSIFYELDFIYYNIYIYCNILYIIKYILKKKKKYHDINIRVLYLYTKINIYIYYFCNKIYN